MSATSNQRAKAEKAAAEVKVALADFAAEGAAAGDAAFSADLLGRRYNEALVHQVVVGALANARQGTRAQKTRAQVSHSHSKMFRQKGTGRARAGMSSTPVRRGGGRAFPSLPNENFRHRTPRKMFRAAMAMMLSKLFGEGRLRVVKNLSLPAAKTKEAVRRFSAMGLLGPRGSLLCGRILLVDNHPDDNLALAARNLPDVIFMRLSSLLPADLANAKAVIFSESAMRECEGVWR